MNNTIRDKIIHVKLVFAFIILVSVCFTVSFTLINTTQNTLELDVSYVNPDSEADLSDSSYEFEYEEFVVKHTSIDITSFYTVLRKFYTIKNYSLPNINLSDFIPPPEAC